jgi:phosphate-selective porin OprO and OprP
MTGRKRSAAHLRAIAGMLAVTGAILPVSAAAQTTTTDVTDLIKNLQSEIGTIEKRHQGEIGAIQKQYQTEIRNLQKQHQAQIQNLQKQLDDLKAAQAAPRAAPPPPSAASAAQAAAAVPAPAPPRAPGAPQPPSGAAQPPAAAGGGGSEIIVGAPPPGLPLPAAGVHVLEPSAGRFGIESADGRNAIFLTGRLHLDAGDYLDYTPGSRFAAVQDLNSGVNARRARIGVIARFMRDWDFNLIYDLGGSGDGFPPDPGALASGLENALVTYSGLKNNGVPLVFDLGYMDVPFTQEESSSSNDIPLVERAAIINVASNIMANDFRSAFGVRSFSDRYWAGAYVTGPTSGSNHTTGEPLGAVGRAGYNISYSPEGYLHLEGDAGALLKPPAPGGIRSITLSDRPELRVDPTQILSTGAALGTAANPLNNVVVYGGGGIANWHNFQVNGEAYRIDVNRQGLATNHFEGGYVEGSWILTGEQRKYSPPAGAYLRPVPEHPFLPFDGSCCGAFELAARYSTIDLNDNFIPRPPLGSNSVGGGQQTVYAVGLNWYPNANMRFLFDLLHGKINKRFSTAAGGGIAGTPPGTPVGGEFNAVVMRTQVAF